MPQWPKMYSDPEFVRRRNYYRRLRYSIARYGTTTWDVVNAYEKKHGVGSFGPHAMRGGASRHDLPNKSIPMKAMKAMKAIPKAMKSMKAMKATPKAMKAMKAVKAQK